MKPVKNNVKILRFEAALNFVNVTSFLDKMNEILQHEPSPTSNLEKVAYKALFNLF